MSHGRDLDREKRLFELIHEVVALPAEERDLALAECDPELGSEVRARLAALAERDESFLASAPHLEAEPLLPEGIGPYRPVELLGEGGMGRVYLAEQVEPVRRRVALKVLRFAALGRESRVRFEAERHAMGRLDHPNVGKILEAGTTKAGEPFFAMELIDGPPITTYCDSKSLSLDERLRLFVDVCRGVDHAHHKLLLHRDIKPSNVLVAEVDGRAVAKLIDFGIAKAVDAGLIGATLATGDRVLGTPGYMSPEARGLGGDVDSRSDVYSLGILFYELLTGTQPWPTDGVSPLQALQRPADARIPRPSTRVVELEPDTRTQVAKRRRVEGVELPRRLRGDLDWIALKALAPEPRERYRSAGDLADDIERYLESEPVLAHAPTMGYLMVKLIRKHRGRVLAAALVVASLVLGVIGTTVGLLHARDERDRAVRAQRSSDQLVVFLKNLFGEADSSLQNPADLSAREILERGAAGLGSQLVDQPRERAVLLHTVGEIYTRWDELSAAERLLTESLDLLNVAGAQSPGELEGDRADVLAKLADLRFKEGRFDDTLRLADEALALLGDRSEPSLRVARLETRAGAALELTNRLDEAERRLHSSRELLEALPEETPGRSDALGSVSMQLGGVAHRRRDGTALDEYRRAVAYYERAHGSESRFLVPPLNRIAYWMVDTGQLDEAERVIRRCLALQERLLGSDTLAVSRSQHLLGRVLNMQGRYADAEQAFRRSVEIRDLLTTEPHPLHANTLALLAYVIYLQDDDRFDEVEALFDRAEQAMEGREPVFPVYSAVMSLRARVEMSESRPEVAEHYLRLAAAWVASLESPRPRYVSTLMLQTAEAIIAQGRGEDARDACRRSLELALQSDRKEWVADRRQALEALGCLGGDGASDG